VRYSLIRNFLLAMIIFSSPMASHASQTDYDGTWAVKLECGPKITPGGRLRDGYTDSSLWVVKNGAFKATRETKYSSTDWFIDLKADRSISVVGNSWGNGTDGVTGRWEHRFTGFIDFRGHQFNIRGARWSGGVIHNECTLNGSLTIPAPASIAAKRGALSAENNPPTTTPSSASSPARQLTKVVPCSQAPITGLPFKECSVSVSENGNRTNGAEYWKMTYSDATSEFSIAYDLNKTAAGAGLPTIGSNQVIEFIRNNPALKATTENSINWYNYRTSNGATYIDFAKPNKRCLGMYDQDGSSFSNQWRMAAAFCKVTDTAMSVDEVKFVVDLIKKK
jgi:hypothetical protein